MKRLVVVVALALAAMAALAAPASAAVVTAPYSDSECLTCHEVNATSIARGKVDFAAPVGNVDFDKCKACHLGTSDGTKATPYEPTSGYVDFANGAPHAHSGTIYDCGDCHAEHQQYVMPFFSFVPRALSNPGGALVATPYGYFLSASSVVNPETSSLHEAHAGNGRIATTLQGYEGWDSQCASCHSAASCDSCHDASTVVHGDHGGAVSCTQAGCHASGNLSPSCVACHTTSEDEFHESAHSSVTVGCNGTGCHSAALWTAHTEYNGGAFTCEGCHNSVKTAVQAAIATPGNDICTDCHTDMVAGTGHRSMHWASPLLKDASGPRYSYNTGSVGTQPTGDCAGCHTSNLVDEHMGLVDSSTGYPMFLPRFDSAGAVLTCATCHNSSDATVAAAIAANKTSCESCHAVHGPMQQVHASSFVDDAQMPCAECHSSNLSNEHNGTYTSSAGLTGCDVCHALYTGVSGAVAASDVQGAISVTNSTKCSACHTGYHADVAPHEATAANSLSCGECHGTVTEGALDVNVIHSTCSTCHKAAAGRINWATATMECESCHKVAGADFHKDVDASHTYSGMSATCMGSRCHSANTLPEEHERFLGRYPEYSSTCTLCHKNADQTRIPANATASCSSCHEIHGDIGTIHTTTQSQACVDCHETADVRLLHGDSADQSCDVCHAAEDGRIDWSTATVECASCHGGLSPVDPNHYPVDGHDATGESACDQCHYKDMKAEHFLATVSPAVTCVSCHELKVDGFTAAWDKTCGACHATNHGEKNAKHVSPTTSCGGAGCHDVADVSTIHQALPGSGCGACHTSPSARATTTTCTASGCHANMGTDHKGAHDSASVNTGGCNGCHAMNLVDEHSLLGLTCATCHSSAVPAVQSAIDADDLQCKSCHPSMHARQAYEFNPKMAGGHRVSADLPGMQSSFLVNGTTYTMGIPAASSFLKQGWTTSSIVPCDACHSYSGATGPHGATMKVNIDPAYPTNWKTAYLRSGTTLGMSSNTIICAKCHDLNGTGSSFSNNVHGDGDHHDSSDGQCYKCHVQVPHGWGRPRLLGYTTDGAPYATATGGISKIALKNYTPNSWSESNCYAACAGDHSSNVSNPWPNSYTAPPATAGSVTGAIKNASGLAISGASVSIAGKSATTGSTGTYTIAGITPGSYTMTVSASGYNGWSGSVSITSGGTTTQNVSLTAVQTVQYGNVSGAVKSGTSMAISGATVSIAGKTATTSSTGSYSVTGIATGTYTLTVTATGYNAWSGSVTISSNTTVTQHVTLTAVAPTATNIARTGTATASSQDSYSYSAAKAIDGSTSSYWRSASGGNQWLRVDFGTAKTFDKVVVRWSESRYARSYRIETSNDGTNWTSRYSTSSGSSGSQTITFSPVSARYVRIYCTQTNDSNYRITEFEVWGY